jgi:hypothetical protein
MSNQVQPPTSNKTERQGDGMADNTTGKYWVHVEMDDSGGVASPREDEINLGVMVLWHRRLRLPSEGEHAKRILRGLDEYGFRTVARWLKVFHGATVVLPVHGYDHGQVRFKASDEPGYPFTDEWDAGVAGLIYDTPATREQCGTAPELIEQALKDEVADYDRWSNGELWLYEVREADGQDYTVVEACGGYYSEKDAKEAGEEAIPAEPTPEQALRAATMRALVGAHAAVQISEREILTAIHAQWQLDVESNPHNPMHVTEGEPHWHVKYGAEDTPHYVTDTVFDALGFAGHQLDHAADDAHESFTAYRAHGDHDAAFDAHAKGGTYHNLGENATILCHQAASPTWMRAPLYASNHEASNKLRLRMAADHHVERINTGGPEGMAMWECADETCEAWKNRDQDQDDE